MTRSEYQDLVDFIAPKFDAIEQRLTRVEVLGEENRHQTQILAEAISTVDRKVDALATRMDDEFRAVRSEMAIGFTAVRTEMAEGFDRLDTRVTRLETSMPEGPTRNAS